MTSTAPERAHADPHADPHAGQEADPVYRMFASRTVTEHVLRGVLGLALAVAAFMFVGDHPWALLGLVGTVVLWRGCPTCWAMGMGATLAGRRTDRGRECADGSCPPRR